MSLSSSIEPSRSFHTTHHTHVTASRPSAACSLHLLYSLSPASFVDPFQLDAHAAHYSFTLWGESDLELPLGAVSSTASLLLLNVSDTSFDPLVVSLPLHARYLLPLQEDVHSDPGAVKLPWPLGFWACPPSAGIVTAIVVHLPDLLSHSLALSSVSSTPRDPFASTHFEHILSPFELGTQFLPLTHTSDSPFDILLVPAGRTTHLTLVEPLTMLVALVCALWFSFTTWKVAGRITSSIKCTKTD